MFYTVFSTNDTPNMQWQSDLLEYSWKRVAQEGVLIRLVATKQPSALPLQKHASCIATRSFDVHPETGDFYPIYNKPASLLQWLYRDRPEGTVLLLDPDCIFRRAVTRHVAPGYPASQQWIKQATGKPNSKNPFGLGRKFAFLKNACARTELKVDQVMIPSLIHTSDLRKICARWLELCSTIRQSYRGDAGEPMWESDMFAYIVAAAEYGLHHEPISLGVCTNWPPAAAPDAPIVHYCQPIKGTDGQELFNKQSYKPWASVDTASPPEQDYGRDLIALVNDYVDDLTGTVRPPSLTSRPKRRDGVMEGRVLGELMLDLPSENRRVWLNSSGKVIWELCEGSLTIRELGARLADEFAADEGGVTADVLSTVSHLRSSGLLQIL
jgi:hypothetical protein